MDLAVSGARSLWRVAEAESSIILYCTELTPLRFPGGTRRIQTNLLSQR